MRSQLFSPQNAEAQQAQPGMQLQNGKMLKVALNGEMLVRHGSMVAYQGNVQFQALGSGSVGKFLKQQLTGEGVPLMKCTGAGDVFLADLASDAVLRHLSRERRWSDVQRRLVQLRVRRPGPHCDHLQGEPGGAQRR